MQPDVVSIDIIPPERRGSSSLGNGQRKPMSTVVLHLEGGEDRRVMVPVRAARVLDEEQPALPCSTDRAFEFIHAVEGRMCFSQLVDMLSRRDHSTGEARDKLSAYGYRPQEVDAAIARATECRFLDDSRFTSTFIEERKARGWGRRKIELELKRRGIDVSEVEGYPEAYFSDDDDLSRARELLARRPVPDDRAFERLVRSLMSKGFSYSVAAEAARERIESEPRA